MDEEEVDMLWDVLDDLEDTLYRLKFADYDWMIHDMEEYARKYGARDANLWYVLYGMENTLRLLGFDYWWDTEVMDEYGEKWGEYRGRG